MKFKSRMELGDVTHHNIKQLKRLNQVIFPVNYNDRFYKDVLEAGELAKLVYFSDIVVGAVCCRVEGLTEPNGVTRRRLYIMTLGCLPAYRRLGLGTLMLEHVFKLCKRDGNIDSIYLHVQVNNDDALAFYKKFGFEIVELAKNYYKRIEPADAYLVEKPMKGQLSTPLAPVQLLAIEDTGISSDRSEEPKENCDAKTVTVNGDNSQNSTSQN